MATATKTPEAPAISTWEIEGQDIVDKASLVGVPLTITGLSFRKGSRGVDYVYCEFEKDGGDSGVFNDSSSTGIKAQILGLLLTKTGEDPEFTTDEKWMDVRILVPKGLRVSEYIPEGRKEKARTYYLAASGRRNRG